jgi:hypothetical protein
MRNIRLWLVLSLCTVLLPALAIALTYTTIDTSDGVVESDSPVLGGTTWETDENMDTDGGTDFYFTWDDTTFFWAITGPYADLEDEDYDWFVAIDVDQLPGSGATTNPGVDGMISHVTFSGDFLPEYLYAFAGGAGWHVSFAWDGVQWVNRGWTDVGMYGGWDGNLTSELFATADTLGNPDSVAIVSWITPENNSSIVASYPHVNPIGTSPQPMTYFWVAKDLGQNVAPVMLPIQPPPPDATVDNEQSFPFTCTAMADITPGDCGSTSEMTFYYTADGSDPDTLTGTPVVGTYDSCKEGADTTDTFYAVIPAADDATVRWIAKGKATNGLVDVSDEIQQFVQGGQAWVGNAGSSPTTCTVWAEIYVGDGGQTAYINFPYTTDGTDPRISVTADTADGVFDAQLGNNDKFYAELTPVPNGTTVNWYAYGTDANDNYAETDTFFTFEQGDTADLYNLICEPDSNFVMGEVAPPGIGAGMDFYWTVDGSDPKTSPTANKASGFHVEDTDTTGKFAAYLTASTGQTIKWYVHAWGSNNAYSDSPNQECVADTTSGPMLCNLTCAPDSLLFRASISPRGYGSEIRFFATHDGSDPKTSSTRATLEGGWIADEDTPGGDCGVPVGVFQVELPGSIAVGDTIKWYVYGWYQPGNKYNGLFGESDVFSCVATVSKAGVVPGTTRDVVSRITNVPNPFGGSTEIVFDLTTRARVSIGAYDVRGRMVAEVFEGILPQGQHAVSWDGRSTSGSELPSGIYFFSFRAGSFHATRKAMLIR